MDEFGESQDRADVERTEIFSEIDELRKELKLKEDIAKVMSDKVQELELAVRAKDYYILELQAQRNRALDEAANFGSVIQQLREQLIASQNKA